MKTGIVLIALGILCLAFYGIAGSQGVHETRYIMPDGQILIAPENTNLTLAGGSSLPKQTENDNELLQWLSLAGFTVFAISGLVVVGISDD